MVLKHIMWNDLDMFLCETEIVLFSNEKEIWREMYVKIKIFSFKELSKKVNEFDQEMLQSNTADQPMAPWGRDIAGFIRVREMSGKLKNFQGQGIVREFYVVSGENACFLKCQGILKFPICIKWWETENDLGSFLNILDIS